MQIMPLKASDIIKQTKQIKGIKVLYKIKFAIFLQG